MSDPLDSLVKGAPLPGSPAKEADLSSVSHTSPIISVTDTADASKHASAHDPTSRSPDSPSMIYLNLLILEASLRAQYLELRARRRHHTFFLLLLSLWVGGFGYALFLAPREDGRGVGGSVYWGVEVMEKVCFLGGVITAILVWATGIWDRGVRWPRRWFAVSNRGLRGFNCKLVIVRRPWWAEIASTLGFFLTNGLFSHTASSSYRYVEPAILREVEREMNITTSSGQDGGEKQHEGRHHPTLHHHTVLPSLSEDEEKRGGHEEDLAPGGDYVKLLLLAKPFSPNFRENWELYRSEYWERENERRALIRAKLQERDRRLAKERWGWQWWLPWHRLPVADKPPPGMPLDGEKGPAAGHHPHTHAHKHSIGGEKEHRRRGSSVRRGSASSSRSATPTLELDETGSVTGSTASTGSGSGAGGAAGGGGVSRKASTASNASDKRRKSAAAKLAASGATRGKRPGVEPRSVTPDIPSPLARESSIASSGSASGNEGLGLGTRTLRNKSSRSSVASSASRESRR